jgi:hypothetical protein
MPVSKNELALYQGVFVLRFLQFFKLILPVPWLIVATVTFASSPANLLALLPERVDSFKRLSRNPSQPNELAQTEKERKDASAATAEYASENGNRLRAEFLQFKRDSDAYSFLTTFVRLGNETDSQKPRFAEGIGTAGFLIPRGVAFFRGQFFVRVTSTHQTEKGSTDVVSFSRSLADQMDKGEGDIPVLVKHLPKWQEAQEQAIYLSGLNFLKKVVANQPILDAIESEDDGNAVVTNYGQSQLLLVEFNTPQRAADIDRKITAKILELRDQGLSIPTGYRRVGNYVVFVFNGDNEQAASQLIDQIKYEQVVQWLGDNPYLLQEAQRRYTETTLGVFLSVVKASGLALVLCFGVGGLFGTLLFVRRRAHQRTMEAFSDAGGMMRLNLDEMTPQTDSSRLLGSGKRL